MKLLMLTSTVAFVASLFLTAVVRAIARRWNIVDCPDGKRKLHGRPVPLLGGVAVYAATVLGLLAARFITGASEDFCKLSSVWMIAAGFVCFVGAIDDRFNMRARVKLVLQIVSVLPIVALGYYVDRVVAFGCPIELGWFGIPLTILWLVGCINALNLIDGMDGLASIIGLSAVAMLSVIAANEGQPHVSAMAIVAAASLTGFLVYNLPPASIFLGDSGSMVIGLSIGLLGMQGSLKTTATLAITAPAVIMTLPMFDIVAAIVRRRLTGRRFDSPDRQHIHHRLLDRGWTPWQVLCLLGALCLTTGAAATAATIFRRDALAWIASVSLVVLMIRLRLFGYDEFALAKEAIVHLWKSGVESWRHFAANLDVLGMAARRNHLRAAIEKAANDEPATSNSELWAMLLRSLQEWDFRQVEFSSPVANRPRRIRWIDPTSPADEPCRWSLSVSLPGGDHAICELSASAVEPMTREKDIALLTSLLTAFGTRFAARVEQFFGPAEEVREEPAILTTYPEHQRKAA